MAILASSGSGVSASPFAGLPPLLQRLASPAWCHPGFAPYWPLLRRLWHMAWNEAGCPEGPLPVFCVTPQGGVGDQMTPGTQIPDGLFQGASAVGAQAMGASSTVGPDGAGRVSRDASPVDLPLSTWDTVHWLPFMNRLAAWRGLRAPDGTPLRFMAGSAVGAVDYERSVASGQIPCKLEGAGARHDFHNALVWLRFPRLKSAINQLHCRQADTGRRLRETSLHGGDGAIGEVSRYSNEAFSHDADAPKARGRGALRDALTLLDENGALWPAADPAWVALLEARQWTALFVERREALLGEWGSHPASSRHDGLGVQQDGPVIHWVPGGCDGLSNGAILEGDTAPADCLRPPGSFLGSHAPVIVGHGLLEKLHQPYKSMTAKLLPCSDPRGSLDWGTARRLWTLAREGELRPALLQPLPIQGWPGWDPANADPAFYRDEKVFRGPRPACDVK